MTMSNGRCIFLFNLQTSMRIVRRGLRAVLLAGAVVGISAAQASDATRFKQTVQIAQAEASSPPPGAGQGQFSTEQKAAIERIVKDYLLNNPEVMVEMQTALEAKMETLQADRLKAVLKESASEIFRRPNAPVVGNSNGDVTVVEFLDYNCGYCRRAFGDVSQLLDKDAKVKFVFKELPILSKGSEEAAKVALAAKLQGKYWEAHRVLFAIRGEANAETALKAVAKLGLDMAKLKKDMEGPEVTSEIGAVRDLAQKMGIQGTPYFLVGDRAIAGAPQNLLDVMTGHIAELRKTGCAFC